MDSKGNKNGYVHADRHQEHSSYSYEDGEKRELRQDFSFSKHLLKENSQN